MVTSTGKQSHILPFCEIFYKLCCYQLRLQCANVHLTPATPTMFPLETDWQKLQQKLPLKVIMAVLIYMRLPQMKITHLRQCSKTCKLQHQHLKNNSGIPKVQLYVVHYKPVLPRSLFRATAIMTHRPFHVSTGVMVSQIKRIFTTFGIESYSINVCKSCVTCIRHNPQENMKPKRGQFPKPTYPSQKIHMDLIELTQSGPYKHCLVMTFAFSKWVEIVPEEAADAVQWQEPSVTASFPIMVSRKPSTVTMADILWISPYNRWQTT